MIFDKFYEILDGAPDSPCMSEIRRGKIDVRSYSMFYFDVMRVAGGLPELKGKRVLVFLRPRIDFFVALLACWAKGAVVLLPNDFRNIRAVKADRIIADRKTRLPARVLFGGTDVSLIENLLRSDRTYACARPFCADNDAALVTFTSGSGGAPKEITRTFGELGRTLDFLTAEFSVVRPSDRFLITLPTYVLADLSLGAESVLFFGKKKNAKNKKIFGRLLRERKVNGLICSAAQLALADGCFPEVAKAFIGGSALRLRDALTCRDCFPNADLRLLYGTSECPVIATADLGAYIAGLERGRILLGRPADGVRVTVTTDGELTAASELTAGADRATGDLGFAENGLLYMLGKKNCSDGAHGFYDLTLAREIERRFPEIGAVAFLHYNGENFLFAKIDRRQSNKIMQAYPFLHIIRKAAPVDPKHGGKIDHRRAVDRLRRYKF